MVDENGEKRSFDLVPINVGPGRWDDHVYQFLKEAGKPFRAYKGFGSRHNRSPLPRRKTAGPGLLDAIVGSDPD